MKAAFFDAYRFEYERRHEHAWVITSPYRARPQHESSSAIRCGHGALDVRRGAEAAGKAERDLIKRVFVFGASYPFEHEEEDLPSNAR